MRKGPQVPTIAPLRYEMEWGFLGTLKTTDADTSRPRTLAYPSTFVLIIMKSWEMPK